MQLHVTKMQLGRTTPDVARPRGRRTVCRASSPVSSVVSEADLVELGKSGLKVPAIGVGAWSWGDRSGYWGYGSEYGKDASQEAFKALVDSGLTFIDTAEVYGYGKSEEFLGEFIKASPNGSAVQVATKFAPLPWRQTSESVPGALRKSLARLGRSKAELYMIHWPGFFLNAWSNDAYVDGLVKCKQRGLAESVGVSNFNQKRVHTVAKRLAKEGVPLASNQVQYSLLYRAPETNGVLEACRENGVTLVAYSPLTQGLLTGKYQPGGPKPYGPRAQIFSDAKLRAVQPLLSLLKAMATEKGKTMSQVALNWCICKGTLPIPGAKNARQVAELAGALGWRLTDAEVAELDRESAKVPAGLGAPFENW